MNYAGALLVEQIDTGIIHQTYSIYSTTSPRQWRRTYYSNNWGAWYQVPFEGSQEWNIRANRANTLVTYGTPSTGTTATNQWTRITSHSFTGEWQNTNFFAIFHWGDGDSMQDIGGMIWFRVRNPPVGDQYRLIISNSWNVNPDHFRLIRRNGSGPTGVWELWIKITHSFQDARFTVLRGIEMVTPNSPFQPELPSNNLAVAPIMRGATATLSMEDDRTSEINTNQILTKLSKTLEEQQKELTTLKEEIETLKLTSS